MEPTAQTSGENRIKKRDLLRRLHALTLKQADAIENDDVESLIDSLNARQRLTAEIEALDAASKELPPLTKAQQPRAPEALQDEAGVEAEMRELLQEMIRLDLENRDKAQNKLGQYKAEIRSERKSTQRVNSYMGVFAQTDGAYFDSKK